MKETEFEKNVDSTMLSGRRKGIDMFLRKSATDKYMFIYIHLCFLISKWLKRT